MRKRRFIQIVVVMAFIVSGCKNKPNVPTGVNFNHLSLKHLGIKGDNWCITWLPDGDQMTSLDDGNWVVTNYWKKGGYNYHNTLYRVIGEANDFAVERVTNYPQYITTEHGWYGFGIYAVNGNIYSMVSLTPEADWSGPFDGMKMLKSPDNGESWHRINQHGEERYLDLWDKAKTDSTRAEMFFLRESGITRDSITAYPFSYCSFVQNGQNNNAARDEYIYLYAPEVAHSNRLLLARVNNKQIEQKDSWEYFSAWKDGQPDWTKDLDKRGAVHVFPEKNEKGEYFGWYSWLPSVVWNPGLNLYVMVNGGTYAGEGLTDSDEDYYNSSMHAKSGSLGLWYSKNPYGPWTQFYYTDYWTVDEDRNKTYQPKLSPKWISEDGKKMILIWSDNLRVEDGKLHQGKYLWNQMEIEIQIN